MPRSFETALTSEVKRIAKQEAIPESSAFLFWFATNILELSDSDSRDAISVEGANDKGIDLFWVDDDDGRVVIGQAKYSRTLDYNAKPNDLSRLESSLHWLSDPEALKRDGKPDLAQAAEEYLKAVADGAGVELWYIYTGPRSRNVEKHIAVYNRNVENVEKSRAERHFPIDMIRSTWEEVQGQSQRVESEDITISGTPMRVDGSFGEAIVTTVSGSEIGRLYEKYQDQLFDRNVRLYLGVRKGSVNAGIVGTLGDPSLRGCFWAYNNGMTILCDSFKVRGTTVRAKNFSIVNGCQTAVSIAQGLPRDDDQVTVLTRFIAASGEIVDEVIRYTNSQNPIRTWDIASQDKTQRRLKAAFKNLRKPYLYVTRRGLPPAGDLAQYRERGHLRKIRIDSMGQFATAFAGDPVLAYAHKAFIFTKNHETAFPPDVRVEEVLFQWLCGEACSEIVREAMPCADADEARLLKKGGTLFVLATMAHILELRNGSTYLRSLDEERVTSDRMAKRLHQYARYSRQLYVQCFLDQADKGAQETTTLVRSPEFYKKVRTRIQRTFQTNSMGIKWLDEALPKIL